MGSFVKDNADTASRDFPFRPWVRRAGLSIVVVAAAATLLILFFMNIRPRAGLSWAREPFVWVYIGTLWAGGVKVFAGTWRPIATIDASRVVLRPLHQLRASSIEWDAMLGTEQMTGGDRMIVYYATPRGMRFVALNLNLIKGRREFVEMMDEKLRAMSFVERTVDRSRYLSKPA
jgi:hypothetical protein